MLAANVLDGVAYLINNAELHGRIRKDALYGVWEAFQAVHATYNDVLHTAVLKVRKHLQLEVGALAPGNVHAQQLLVPFGCQLVINLVVCHRKINCVILLLL